MTTASVWRVLAATAVAVGVAAASRASLASSPATKPDAASVGPSFVHEVSPLITRLGCAVARCHGGGAGSGGLKLSLFGAEPWADYDALVKQAEGRRIDRVRPDASPLVRRALDGCAGADRSNAIVARGSAEQRLLVNWISRGAPWDAETRPALTRITTLPAKSVLPPAMTARLKVVATFSDGSSMDVTTWSLFRSSDPRVATVGTDGVITAGAPGESWIVANYLRHPAVTRVVVPRPIPVAVITPPPNNSVDEIVLAKLAELGVPPSEVCSDQVFVRRVFLDAIGMLPTAEETRAFIADPDPARRAKLVDRLLEREEFADVWAMKWGELLRVKSEYPVRIWPKAVQTYHRWVRDAIECNKPYDQFVRELLVSSGSNFRDGPANYYRAVTNRDPQAFAETTALLFMGVRLSCARCHGHPSEDWALDDNLGMAAFFAQVRFKPTQEWKEEVVFVDPDVAYRPGKAKAPVRPRVLGAKVPVAIGPGEDPRVAFAAWLTAPENPWFARNAANRVWSWLMGRGLVEEADDLRASNPPSDPELLDHLASELMSHKFDLKHLFRLILTSKTYQLSGVPTKDNVQDDTHFAHYRVRRLGAEQLLDAITRVTETPESFGSSIPEPYVRLPRDMRAVQLGDGSFGTPFLEVFGRPPRDTPYEAERCLRPSMRQALALVNSSELDRKIVGSRRLARLIEQGMTNAQIVDDLYLAALSRPPTEAERAAAVAYVANDPKARLQGLQDVLWAVLNTQEFLFNH
jgi:hypothetical protein